MDIAEMMGVRVVPHGLIEVDNKWAYISKRIDRLNNEFYAMEDFCQLSGRLTLDKYKSSYERCAGIIKRYSVMPGFDMSEFYLRLLVCFVTGNSDMHLKNFSLIERDPGSREYVLSSAYDLLPVNVIIPSDPDELALTLNGKNRNLRRKDFIIFAQNIGIEQKPAERMISKIVSLKQQYIQMCSDSYLPRDMKEILSNLISKRIEILE